MKRISIYQLPTVSACAIGRQSAAPLDAPGQQEGPAVIATLWEDGDAIEQLVVVGHRRNPDVIRDIRAFVAEFPGAEINDRTTITARTNWGTA